VTFADLFPAKPVMGMVHMPALPGAPRNDRSMEQLVDWALAETAKLERAGLDACIVENVGDVPSPRSSARPR